MKRLYQLRVSSGIYFLCAGGEISGPFYYHNRSHRPGPGCVPKLRLFGQVFATPLKERSQKSLRGGFGRSSSFRNASKQTYTYLRKE